MFRNVTTRYFSLFFPRKYFHPLVRFTFRRRKDHSSEYLSQLALMKTDIAYYGSMRYPPPPFFSSLLIGMDQGGNLQNFLGKFVRFFVTLRCFYRVVIHRT
jgi:hypothetical protein